MKGLNFSGFLCLFSCLLKGTSFSYSEGMSSYSERVSDFPATCKSCLSGKGVEFFPK